MCDDYAEVIRNHQVFIAERKDQLIGVLVLKRTPADLLLDNVAVLPEFQGQGFGGKLLEFAESEALKQGFLQLYLYTHECMVENIGIYTHLGYRKTKRCTEMGYHRIYMRKVLA